MGPSWVESLRWDLAGWNVHARSIMNESQAVEESRLSLSDGRCYP